MNRGPILVVEDDPGEVELMRAALDLAGSGILYRFSGTASMRSATSWKRGSTEIGRPHPLPCLVLLDLELPKRSGVEVVERVKREPHLRTVPLVMFTSSRAPGDMESAYRAGANSYLNKPSDFDRFVDLIRATSNYWMSYNLTSGA